MQKIQTQIQANNKTKKNSNECRNRGNIAESWAKNKRRWQQSGQKWAEEEETASLSLCKTTENKQHTRQKKPNSKVSQQFHQHKALLFMRVCREHSKKYYKKNPHVKPFLSHINYLWEIISYYKIYITYFYLTKRKSVAKAKYLL